MNTWPIVFLALSLISIALALWHHDHKRGKESLFSLFLGILSIIGFVVNPSLSAKDIDELGAAESALPAITQTAQPTESVPKKSLEYQSSCATISDVQITDQSDEGINTGFGTDHFRIAYNKTLSDNFGNTYSNVAYFSWNEYYANEGYVVFYVEPYSTVTGLIVAKEGARPEDGSFIEIYIDDTLVEEYTDISKTSLPVEISFDISKATFLKIRTNSEAYLYADFEFVYS